LEETAVGSGERELPEDEHHSRLPDMGMPEERTTPEVLQREIQRRIGGRGRLGLALDMSVAARTMTLARLRLRYPHYSDLELRKALLRQSFAPACLPPPLR